MYDFTGINIEYSHEQLNCFNCGKTYAYFSKSKKVQCPNCRKFISIPNEHKNKWVQQEKGTLMALDIEQPDWEEKQKEFEKLEQEQKEMPLDAEGEPIFPIKLKGQDLQIR